MKTIDRRRASICTLAAVAGLLALGFSDGLAQTGEDLILVPEESSLSVSGTSSLHDWSCEAREAELTAVLDTGAGWQIRSGAVRVPVRSLRCGRGPMDDNLRKALDAEDHPEIRFELAESVDLPELESESVELRLPGWMTVADSTRTLDPTVTVSRTDEGRLRVRGEVSLLMSDFGVEPPTAMLGVLKTDDRMSVHFDLTLRRP